MKEPGRALFIIGWVMIGWVEWKRDHDWLWSKRLMIGWEMWSKRLMIGWEMWSGRDWWLIEMDVEVGSCMIGWDLWWSGRGFWLVDICGVEEIDDWLRFVVELKSDFDWLRYVEWEIDDWLRYVVGGRLMIGWYMWWEIDDWLRYVVELKSDHDRGALKLIIRIGSELRSECKFS